MATDSYSPTQQQHLDRIEAARRALHEAELALDQAVWDGKGVGLSWADLATVFGTTRSAVQQRFSRPAKGALF